MSNSNPFPTSHWPQQSPIKIFRSESFLVQFPKDYLKVDYQDAPFAGTFEGEAGHKNFVLAKPHPGSHPPLLEFGDATAELKLIHLHMPSEHDLEGSNQDGEIHLVHEIKNPQHGSELIVLGIFFAKSKKPLKSDVFRTWADELKSAKKGKKPKEVEIDASKLLPSLDKWYRYEGSLTSGRFEEKVTWIVFPTPLGIASDDLQTLKKEAHQPERCPQAINRRYVIRNFNE